MLLLFCIHTTAQLLLLLLLLLQSVVGINCIFFQSAGDLRLGDVAVGDNKGLAAQLLEKAWSKHGQKKIRKAATKDALKDFVAAFAQSSVGDSSPNVQGAFCLDTGTRSRTALLLLFSESTVMC